MADNARFGGQGQDPLDARVERAFSDAVDRQVAEQRALNQLVETAADRLAAIEAGLRSLRETTSTQGVALRAELQEHVARLAEDVQERFTKLASEIDRLRQTNTDHAVRLVQMAQATESSLATLESRYAGLADEVERVADEAPERAPEPVGVDTARIAEALRDVVEDQLTGIRAQLLARMEALEERIETLPNAREIGSPDGVSREAVGEEVEQLRQAFDGRLDSVLARLEQAESDRERRLDELAARLETLVAGVNSVDESFADHAIMVGQVTQEGEERTAWMREALDDLRADVVHGRVTPEDLDDKLVRLRDEIVGTQREELTGVVEQLHRATGSFATEVDELQALVAAVVATGSRNEEQLDLLRDDVLARIDDKLRTGVDGMRVAIHAVIDRRLGEVDERIASAEERFAGLREDVSDTVDRRLGEVTERLASAEERFAGLRDDVTERLEANDRHLAELRTGVRERLDEAAGVFDELAASVRQDFEDGLTAAESRFGEFRDEFLRLSDERLGRAEQTVREATADVGVRLGAAEESFGNTRDAVAGRLDEAESRFEIVRDSLSSHLADTRDRLDALRADVQARLDAAQGRLDEIASEVAQRLEQADARFEATQEQLRLGQERALEETRDRLETVARDVTTSLRADATSVQERVDEAVAVVEERLPLLVQERLDGSVEAIEDRAEQANRRLQAAEDGLREVIGDLGRLGDDLDGRIGRGIERAVTVARHEAADAVADVTAVAERVSRVLDGVRELESTLVKYLDARDRHLERQRTRIFYDLLDEFADDLSRRQRSRIGERIRAAREAVVERFGDGDDGDEQQPRPSAAPTSPRRAEERTDGSLTSGSLLAELLGEDAETDAGAPADVDTDEIPVIQEDERAVDAAGDVAAEPSQAEPEGHVCPECGFVAKSGGGLASHRRTHG